MNYKEFKKYEHQTHFLRKYKITNLMPYFKNIDSYKDGTTKTNITNIVVNWVRANELNMTKDTGLSYNELVSYSIDLIMEDFGRGFMNEIKACQYLSIKNPWVHWVIESSMFYEKKGCDIVGYVNDKEVYHVSVKSAGFARDIERQRKEKWVLKKYWDNAFIMIVTDNGMKVMGTND